MALGMKKMMDAAKNTATNLAGEGLKSTIAQGVLGNYSEVSIDELNKNYGMYLMEGEGITKGFKLIRDMLIFTDKRMLLIDKQGVTGTKTRVKSINLFSIYSVEVETSGFGFDDCELTFSYITTPNLKAHTIEYASYKLEFPKNYPVHDLYVYLQTLAYENCLRLNA